MPTAPAFWHYYRELAKYILLPFLLLLLSYAFWAPIGPCSEHSSCLEGNLRVENPPDLWRPNPRAKAFYMTRNLQRTSAGWRRSHPRPWGYGVLVIYDNREKKKNLKSQKGEKEEREGRGWIQGHPLNRCVRTAWIGQGDQALLSTLPLPSHCGCQFSVIPTPCFFKELFTS